MLVASMLALLAPVGALRQVTVRTLEGREAVRACTPVSELCAEAILSAETKYEKSILSSALIRDLQQRVPTGALLLAEDVDGGIIGSAAITVDKLSPDALDAQRLGNVNMIDAGVRKRPLLSSVAVVPRARGRGLGKRLCREAESLAKEWGYDEVLLKVESKNGKARGMYRKLGYRVVSVDKGAERPEAGNAGLEFVPTVQVAMRKSLTSPPVDSVVGYIASLAAAVYATQVPEVQQAAGLAQDGSFEEAARLLLTLLPASVIDIV